MAEPELSGLRQERHAKTIEIAQKEVLTCIGKDYLDFTEVICYTKCKKFQRTC